MWRQTKGDFLGSRNIIIVETDVTLSLSQLHSEKIGYVSLNNKKIGGEITSMTRWMEKNMYIYGKKPK